MIVSPMSALAGWASANDAAIASAAIGAHLRAVGRL
jgi:hypothetical protein